MTAWKIGDANIVESVSFSNGAPSFHSSFEYRLTARPGCLILLFWANAIHSHSISTFCLPRSMNIRKPWLFHFGDPIDVTKNRFDIKHRFLRLATPFSLYNSWSACCFLPFQTYIDLDHPIVLWPVAVASFIHWVLRWTLRHFLAFVLFYQLLVKREGLDFSIFGASLVGNYNSKATFIYQWIIHC